MIQTKYLIIIGAIICLLVLYYFYDEISSVKKMLVPAYQKTMALEMRVQELEKKINEMTIKKKQIAPKNDSPALSITYQSDMVKKNGNLSVRYADLSETEAKELLKRIDQNKVKQQQQINTNSNQQQNMQQPQQMNIHQHLNQMKPQIKKVSNIQSGDISDFLPAPTSENNIVNKGLDMDETETINFKIADVLKKNQMNMESKTDQMEYQKILNGLSKNEALLHTDAFDNDTELDPDIIKSISESIQYADMPSDTILSDLPVITAPKRANKNISKNVKNQQKKKSEQ